MSKGELKRRLEAALALAGEAIEYGLLLAEQQDSEDALLEMRQRLEEIEN